MKRIALLIGLALSACSFPQFNVDGGGGGGAGASVGGSAGSTNGGTATVGPCEDGERNGDETGIDCGIVACSKVCPVGQGCDTLSDCNGGACLRGVCQAESCTDELENALESDVDCGGDGGCRRCTVNERCHTVADCDGGACVTGQCRAPTCQDELKNTQETDIDCGGGECEACAEGKACLESSDCDNVACVKEKCQPRDCSDGVTNQDETDLDCGGSCPSPCDDGLRCKEGSDCESGVCSTLTKLCAAPTCNDGVRNGPEPTTDCGASCPTRCALLDSCVIGDDCASGTCGPELCVPSEATDEVLSTLGWVAFATHSLGPNNPASNAIDGSLNTNWISGADQVADTMWFEVDMKALQVFYSIELIIDSASDAEDAPELVDVWLSNDGVFTTKAMKNVEGKQKTSIDFTEPQVARHIKLSLSPGTSKKKWWRIDELRVRQ